MDEFGPGAGLHAANSCPPLAPSRYGAASYTSVDALLL
jgi:hypothetical protein